MAPGFLLLVCALGRVYGREHVAGFAFPFIVWPAMPMWCYCFFKKVLDYKKKMKNEKKRKHRHIFLKYENNNPLAR